MERRTFLSQVGFGAAALLLPACFGSLESCQKAANNTAPQKVDFTIDISSGPLSVKGGFLLNNGVIVAFTKTGTYIAVASTCTHQGTTINYNSTSNNFVCPNHGAIFDSGGSVLQGPASVSLTNYNTTLTGKSLRVFS